MKLVISVIAFLASGVVFASGSYGGSGGSSYRQPSKRSNTYRPSQRAHQNQELRLNNTFKQKLMDLKEADVNEYDRLMELKRTDRQTFLEELQNL